MFDNYTAKNFQCLSLIYATFILAASLASVPSGPSINIGLLMHAILYFGFAFVLWKGFGNEKFLIAAFAFGVVIEIIQPYFSRTFDYFDMAANGIGIFALYWMMKKKN